MGQFTNIVNKDTSDINLDLTDIWVLQAFSLP